jgi:ATP/maltotriose-dependent transcriptional regulator MalT
MNKSIPQVCNGFLSDISGTHDIPQLIPLESAEWYEWLEHHHVFGFASPGKNFTARKEQRQGGWYWYAYRRKYGALSTAYLGKSKGLTWERLQAISSVLALKSNPSIKRPSLQNLTPLDTPTQWKTPLVTKVSIPPVYPHLISRISLIGQLNAYIHHKLVLLSASAGSGKTTLLCQWAAQCSWPVVWLSLEDSDNDPVRFWTYILAALEHGFQAGIGKCVQTLLRMAPSVSMEEVVTELVNAIASHPQNFTLVLDNYHAIHNQLIHSTLIFLLDHLPNTMHLMISSRTDPPLPLTRLRVSCQFAELRTLDLQFTSDEMAAFFSKAIGRTLQTEMILILGAVTEGWAAGLQLMTPSIRRMQDISSVLATFADHDCRIFDYLDNEILQKQPRKVQHFLLTTSILDRLNGPLCDALTGQRNSQHMLEQLEKANLFIIPLDHQRRWYRYHHLFRELLRTRLDTTQPGKLSQLHERACLWYKQHGPITEEIEHALTAGDFLLVANIIDMCNYTQTIEQLTLAQISLTQNQAEKVLDVLEQQLHIAETQGLIGRMIALCLLKARVYQKQQAIPKALQTLERVLCLTEPGYYIRLFIKSGPPLRELFISALARIHTPAPGSHGSASPGYLKQAQATFEQPETAQKAEPECFIVLPIESGQIETLSKREAEVLHLVLTGLATREIARQLVLAENTVRWHIRNIYSKLQVHNRAQLIVQTQHLGYTS